MVFHLLGCTTRSSLWEYLSLMLDRNCLQRLRVSVPFPVPLSMPTSQTGIPVIWLHFHPVPQPGLQCPSTGAVRGSTPLAAEIPSHLTSPGDRDWVIISSPASSSCCEGPASSLSLCMQTDLVLDFFFCTRVTAASTGCSCASAAGCVATVPVALLSSP